MQMAVPLYLPLWVEGGIFKTQWEDKGNLPGTGVPKMG